MKKRILLVVFAVVGLGLLALGLTLNRLFTNETSFRPSPDGKWVASVIHKEISLPIPPEGLELSSSVSVRIRPIQGWRGWTIPVSHAKKSYQTGYGDVSLVWSPDGRKLAFCNQGHLNVADNDQRACTPIAQSASSFRWLDNDNICFIQGPLEDEGTFSILRAPTQGGQPVAIITGIRGSAFHPLVSASNNQFSPDGVSAAFINSIATTVYSLRDTNLSHSVSRDLTASFCWWADAGDKCLVHGLETVKTGPSPEGIHILDVIYQYDKSTGSFTDISGYLRSLNDTNCSAARPQAPERIWSADGRWFLTEGMDRGAMKNWLCIPQPWSALCLQESAGAVCHNPAVSPQGSRIAVMCSDSEWAREGDLCVIEVRSDAGKGLNLSPLQKVGHVKAGSWFWAPDGQSLLARTGRGFSNYELPKATR
jgi:hypothetical protein